LSTIKTNNTSSMRQHYTSKLPSSSSSSFNARKFVISRFYSTHGPKKHVVVVGGGAAGLSIANEKVRKGCEVTLIEPSDVHYYQPLWTLVGAGISKVEDSMKPQSKVIDKRINWVQKRCVNFDPENNKVIIQENENQTSTIGYDALVVATGLEIYWDKIKGLKESLGKNGVCSNYSVETVPFTWKFLSEATGGNFLFTFPPTPVKCAGAPQKIMYLVEDYLNSKGLREKCNFGFYSAVGELFAVKHYADALNKICDSRDLNRYFGHDLIEVDGENRVAKFKKVKAITDSE